MSGRQVLQAMGVLMAGGVLAGCGSHTVPEANVNPEARVGSLVVSDIHVVRPASGSYAAGSSASVDFLLQNTGSVRDQLDAATSPVAARVDLLLDGRQLQSVLVPARATVTRGTQLRLVRLRTALRAGDSASITLHFRRSGEVTVQAPLR